MMAPSTSVFPLLSIEPEVKLTGGVKAFALSNVTDIPRWMPGEAASGYSQCLPYLELAAGGMLVLGLTTRVGGLLAAAIYGIILSSHGLHLEPQSAHRHLPVYLAVSILLLCLGGGKLTLDCLFFRKKSLQGPSGGQ